jgi:hypothetical protein
VNWLVLSIVLSVVLTIVLNAGLRLFPGASERAARRLEDMARPRTDYDAGPRVRVFFPWRTMLVASLVLTLLLNLRR